MAVPAIPAERSAAVEFASINELLIMLAEHVDDCGSLWALSLSSHRFHSIFAKKLGERVVFRIKDNDDEDTAERIVNECLIPGPYLPDLEHLELEVNNGPNFSKRTLNLIAKLIGHVPNLKKFTWISLHGDVPTATLMTLGQSCRQLAEIHLSCGAELVKPQTKPFPRSEQSLFEQLHTVTCRRVEVWLPLHILHECPEIEHVEGVEMMQMQQSGWLHTGYHGALKAMVSHEEHKRRRNKKPLKMNLCYSIGPRSPVEGEPIPCPVCTSPGMQFFIAEKRDEYQTLWKAWALGRARLYFHNQGEIRHLSYEFPHPDTRIGSR